MKTFKPPGRRRPPRGFTLIELGVVVLIIGLLASFILIAAFDGIERGRERATQALILKLDTALEERMSVLLAQQVNANLSHRCLAAGHNADFIIVGPNQRIGAPSARADVIARVDYLKAEVPDVFFIQFNPDPNGPNALPAFGSSGFSGPFYPFNFAAVPCPGAPIPPNPLVPNPPTGPTANFILPLGQGVLANPAGFPGLSGAFLPGHVAPGYNAYGTGIYGASYGVAGGLTKNLGYLPQGYDGVDNNGNGWIDEWGEGINSTNEALVRQRLLNHTHATARAEMLYALLVESPGALLSADSFTTNEVRDTDQDGMPEFVDAWGQPLQFFRWPFFYHSSTQKGLNPQGYDGLDNDGDGVADWPNDPKEFSYYFAGNPLLSRTLAREQNPLDPNETLIAPAWWSALASNPRICSDNAREFQRRYFSLVDPSARIPPPTTPEDYLWERNGFYKRRAFYFKALILSGGPDQRPGVPRRGFDPISELDVEKTLPDLIFSVRATPGERENLVVNSLILGENVAASVGLARLPGFGGLFNVPDPAAAAVTRKLIEDGQDDITNHNLRVSGAAVR